MKTVSIAELESGVELPIEQATELESVLLADRQNFRERASADAIKHAEILLTAKVEQEVKKHLAKAQEGAYALGAEAGKQYAEARIIKALRELKKSGDICRIDEILSALGATEAAKK